MSSYDLDPAYKNALREALVVVAIYLVALVYTITCCGVFGYGRDPKSITLYSGIPDWVLWGVIAPWAVSAAVTFWFCFWYMVDDDLDAPPEYHDVAVSATGETLQSIGKETHVS